MNIIISPAKKMNVREDELDPVNLPCFLSKAETLKEYIRSLSLEQARTLWACNEAIAGLNYERFQTMDLTGRLSPALLSYEGIQYQYMAPGVFETRHWDYVQKHLRILSGFYGILRPLDGIVPYRLEMQAKVKLPPERAGQEEITSLYGYWGDLLYRELVREDKVVVNLASKEYSKAIEPFLTPDITYLTCVFGVLETDKEGRPKVKVKATEAKMARGEMVRFMAEHQVESPEELKGFDGLGYCYHGELSGETEYVFLKGKL
ncbi:peroxide stress protein YaaA [Enterocloster sp. OA13]|uniref:peroxide stress protein YaaA n=1 Tax=Enterocloster sp. OA13 TaxID=2914161 RepID=UPI001F064535|nr:peroxide stress protein YaaA [Enterocloster sp. OA13]